MKSYLINKVKITVLFVALLFVLPSVCWATTYYVDSTNGSDSNAGTTPDAPWKTIAKVIDAGYDSFLPGDFVLFKRGCVWREMLKVTAYGAAGNHITFGAYGSGDIPIIKGSDLVAGWTIHNGNIWKAVFAIEPSYDQVFFDGNRGTKQAGLGNLNTEKDWYWSSNILYVYSGSNPSTAYTHPGIEVSVREICTKADRGYITFQDLHLSQAILCNLLLWDPGNFTIDRVLAENSYVANIIIGEGSAVFSNCEVCFSGNEHGIYVSKDTSKATIQNCHIHHNAQEGIQVNPEASDGIISDVIIRYNHIHDNRNGMGLHGTNQSSIYANVLYNNSRAGISFYDRSWGDGFGCTNNVVYNNTIMVPETSDGAACGISVRHYSNSNTFKNNIIYVLDTESPNWFIDSSSTDGHVIDNNCSFRKNGSAFGYVDGVNYTWTAWKALGYDIHGISQDPLFISISLMTDTDFKLQSNSPCRDAGTNVGLTSDYFGNAIPSTNPDMGFNEISKISPPGNLRISDEG